MEWKDLQKVVRFIDGLHHHSLTIENDIRDALDRATTMGEFKVQVESNMQDLQQEINTVMDRLRML